MKRGQRGRKGSGSIKGNLIEINCDLPGVNLLSTRESTRQEEKVLDTSSDREKLEREKRNKRE
jgi:hypothetical protein